MKRNLLLLSNSTGYKSTYLEWALEMIQEFLSYYNVQEVLFIPFAQHNYDKYTATAREVFLKIGFNLTGIQSYENPITAIEEAEAIFIGGGNTFRLLKLLYDYALVEPLQKRVLSDGIPYIGSSAGTNVATFSISTTNDMPIVYPPTFIALGFLPFNINPHYTEPVPNSKHMEYNSAESSTGPPPAWWTPECTEAVRAKKCATYRYYRTRLPEHKVAMRQARSLLRRSLKDAIRAAETREKRINQFHEESDIPVLGLREGSLLHVCDGTATLKGERPARLFLQDSAPKEYEIGSDMSFLLQA